MEVLFDKSNINPESEVFDTFQFFAEQNYNHHEKENNM